MANMVEQEVQQRIERLEHLVAALESQVGSTTIQSGSTPLVNGISPFISATITPTSKILIGVGTAVADALTKDYAALDVDRTFGAPPVGGFVVRAFTAAGREVANTNAADQSTSINWVVVNS